MQDRADSSVREWTQMDAEELARLIGELEDSVERLRALYDQYFMGLARIEPLTLRKEVDRRLFVLRREHVRNTGVRFRLQGVIQRYNTYQQYWQRIVRDIENGTYQRDLGRAAARFGEAAALTVVGRRRQQMIDKGLAKRAERAANRSSAPPGPLSEFPSPHDASAHDFPGMEVDLSDFHDDPAQAKPPRSSRPPPLPSHLQIPPPPPEAAAPRPRAAAVPSTSFSATSNHAPHPPPPHIQSRPLPPPAAPDRPPARRAAPPPPPAAQPAQPSAAAPLAPAAPLTAPLAPASAPASAATAKPLSHARVAQLFGEYVEAKRRCNESTAALTIDKLAATLEKNAAQLARQHQAHKVDFEVIIKDGSARLKPIVKKAPTKT